VVDALAATGRHADLVAAIAQQCSSLDLFGELLSRYPSPLEEQRLGARRRDVDTLVEALCATDRGPFTLKAPTQAIVGRALNLALVNFLRLLWHVSREVPDAGVASRLRERAARSLRTNVYSQLVEEVLSDLVTDVTIELPHRQRAVRHLALLWGHRRTWRVSEFFPVLESTWEARTRVRVIGGSLMGVSEMFQLLIQGGDTRFVELLTDREHGAEEAMAFREFLFGRSSEELERMTERMARDHLTSIELDSQLASEARDAGTVFYEFFQARLVQSNARRLATLPGPKRTAEGYVVLAWLEQQPS
jgi:hypothetical protein